MAAERKLKGEIDRTLKKVQEGQEVFEDLWQQVHECDNTNQREKLEDQLKKEIKKLQRLREQIKGWITNADIKDKQPLLDARKSIEKDMERFKVCEREMKMAGRAGMPKATDPKEKAKDDAREWINNAVESLQGKIDSMEYELEELQGQLKKKQKPPARVSELEETTTRHKEHIARLEKVLRCIENETIQPDESGMELLRNDMDIYLNDECEDNGIDVTHVDGMYEELADRLEAVDLAAPALAHGHKLGKAKDKEELEKERERERDAEKQRAAVAAAKAQLIAQGNHNIQLNQDEDVGARKAAAANAAAAAAAAGGAKGAGAAAPVGAVGGPAGAAAPPPPPPPPGAARAVLSPGEKTDAPSSSGVVGSAGSVGTPQQAPATPRGATHQEPSPPLNAATPNMPVRPGGATSVVGTPAPPGRVGPPPGMAAPGPAPGGAWADAGGLQAGNASGKSIIAKLAAGVTGAGGPPPGIAAARPGAPPGYTTAAGSASKSSSIAESSALGMDGGSPWTEVGADGVKDGGDAGGRLSLPGAPAAAQPGPGPVLPPLPPLEPPNYQPVAAAHSAPAAKQLLEACFTRSHPAPADTDLRAYRPRHPAMTPLSYPRLPHEVTDQPALFRKVDPEVLFFAFYFQPGSHAQFMAAHELKRQSWRFHKHHNAWFQRFTEPAVTNEEYEQGAYVYFDYNIVHDDMQTGWCYRRKESFTFRYDALEDELRPPAVPPPATPVGAPGAVNAPPGTAAPAPAGGPPGL